MITYEVRGETLTVGYATKEAALQHKSRHPHPTLWQVERESEAEAAVRRMGWIERQTQKGDTLVFAPPHSTISGLTASQFIDRDCPPPAPKETQLDWSTGEPIEAVYCWQIPSGLFMAANVPESEFKARQSNLNYLSVLEGRSATSTTQDAAIANLRAIRASLKSQTR